MKKIKIIAITKNYLGEDNWSESIYRYLVNWNTPWEEVSEEDYNELSEYISKNPFFEGKHLMLVQEHCLEDIKEHSIEWVKKQKAKEEEKEKKRKLQEKKAEEKRKIAKEKRELKKLEELKKKYEDS